MAYDGSVAMAGGGLMVGKTLTQHAGAMSFHNCSSEGHGLLDLLNGLWMEIYRNKGGSYAGSFSNVLELGSEK